MYEHKQENVTHTVTHVRLIVRMCDVNLVWFGTQNETLHTLLHNELKWYRCVMLTRMCSSKHLWLVLLCGARKDVKGNCSFKGSRLVWYLTRDKERKWIHLSNLFLSTSILWGTVEEILCACKTLAVALAEQVFTDWLAAKIWDLKTLCSCPQSVPLSLLGLGTGARKSTKIDLWQGRDLKVNLTYNILNLAQKNFLNWKGLLTNQYWTSKNFDLKI